MERPYSLEDLLNLMARLRDPETGCPWDLKQTRQSLIPHTLEEVYEVVECIEEGDFEHLKEELGDLLLQIIFYAQLAQEEARYNFADIVDNHVYFIRGVWFSRKAEACFWQNHPRPRAL